MLAVDSTYQKPDSELVDISTIRSLSHLINVRSMGIILLEWLVIGSAIALHQTFPHPLIYLVSWVIIGSRMYALYSLTHEGMHYHIVSNKKLNDFLTRIFLAWPLFLSLSRARQAHLDHHRHLKTDQDPEMAHLRYHEFQFPKTKTEFFLILMKDILGINFMVYFLKKSRASVKAFFSKLPEDKHSLSPFTGDRILKIIYYAATIAIIMRFNLFFEFTLYWLIPYITLYQFFNRVRLSTEHFNMDEGNRYKTRSVKANLIGKLFFSPHNLGYHIEHHLYPSVPFYRLPELNRILLKNELFLESAYISQGYEEVIVACVR